MRFLVDECTGPLVARWLQRQGHDVFSVYHRMRGATDDSIMDAAEREDRVIITNDKDFGELILRLCRPHRGVILLRPADERAANKIAVLTEVLKHCSENEIAERYLVATETTLRVSRG